MSLTNESKPKWWVVFRNGQQFIARRTPYAVNGQNSKHNAEKMAAALEKQFAALSAGEGELVQSHRVEALAATWKAARP